MKEKYKMLLKDKLLNSLHLFIFFDRWIIIKNIFIEKEFTLYIFRIKIKIIYTIYITLYILK